VKHDTDALENPIVITSEEDVNDLVHSMELKEYDRRYAIKESIDKAIPKNQPWYRQGLKKY